MGRSPSEAIMRMIFAFAVLAIMGLQKANADIWDDPTGDAVFWLQYSCEPCCKVTNLHATRSIEAKLFTAMWPVEIEIAPSETKTFETLNAECMKAGFGLEANFIDDLR